MKNTLTVLIWLALLGSQCRGKDNFLLIPIDYLPPFTQTGEYTFGCLVNGEAFVPDNRGDITAIYQQGVLILGADAKVNDFTQGIGIDLKAQMIKERSYILSSDPERSIEYTGSTCRYEYEDLIEGILTISHFDSINYIVAGTFEFITATKGCDTIRVTDGRFDIPYIP